MRASLTLETEIGPLTVTEADGAIAALDWGARAARPQPTPLLQEAARQIKAYLAGRLTAFDFRSRRRARPSSAGCSRRCARSPMARS